MEEKVADSFEEKQRYKSRAAQGYTPSIDVTLEEEAQILGKKKTLKQTYQGIEDSLLEFEIKIKSLGLENKSGLSLVLYNTLDKLGLYPKEKLIDREIQRTYRVVNQLEKVIEQYDKAANDAREKSVDSENIQYKAEILIERYDGMMDALSDEIKNLKEDGNDIREKIRKGDAEEGLTTKLIGVRAEVKKISYDLRNIKRDRDKAASAVVKSYGKGIVHTKNQLIREGLLRGLEEQYNKADVLASRLEDLKESGKNKSLLGAIRTMKESEDTVSNGTVIATEYDKQITDVLGTLNKAQRENTSTTNETLEKLTDLSHEGQSQMYMEAKKISQISEESDFR